MRQSQFGARIEWRVAAYHNVLETLQHAVYAGAYVFGRTTQRTRIIEGRPRKTTGHQKPMSEWSVLIRDHHTCYISWEEFERNQRMIARTRICRKGPDGSPLVAAVLC